MPGQVTIRFYEELNDFLPPQMRKRDVAQHLNHPGSVKDFIENMGVPHTEVDLILVNGQSVGYVTAPNPDWDGGDGAGMGHFGGANQGGFGGGAAGRRGAGLTGSIVAGLGSGRASAWTTGRGGVSSMCGVIARIGGPVRHSHNRAGPDMSDKDHRITLARAECRAVQRAPDLLVGLVDLGGDARSHAWLLVDAAGVLRTPALESGLLAGITRKSADELGLAPGRIVHAQVKSVALLG